MTEIGGILRSWVEKDTVGAAPGGAKAVTDKEERFFLPGKGGSGPEEAGRGSSGLGEEGYCATMMRWVEPLARSSFVAGDKKRDSQLGMAVSRMEARFAWGEFLRVPRKAMDWKACFRT